MAFDITSVLKGVSGPDTGKEQIEYIPVDQIDPDPNNFYSLDGLDDLAGNIELIGLQQPLRDRGLPVIVLVEGWAAAGLHPIPGENVDAPLFEEFPLTLECRAAEITDGPGGVRIIGEVVNMSADESILGDDGMVDAGKADSPHFYKGQKPYRPDTAKDSPTE